MIYDAIIIGAGVMGSSTAFQLTEQNKKCLLMDQFPLGHTYGSSHGESRIIRRSYPEKHFANLMKEAYKLWNSLAQHYNEQFIVTTGGLDFGSEDSKDMKNVLRTIENLGVQHTILNAKEISNKFSAISPNGDIYGVYQPEAGVVLASKALSFFQTTAQKKGLDVVTGERVSLLKEEQDHIVVSTKSKSFITKKVIICAGSWINEFFKNYNIAHRIKVLPVNFGYWKVSNNDAFKVGSFPIFIAWSDKTFYGFPSLERTGFFKMGAHYSYSESEFRAKNLDKKIDQRIVDDMVNFIGKTFPFVISSEYEIDSCFYTMNNKENFILDFHPDNANIIFGGGFSGHGFKFAPLIGKILSEMVIDGQSQYDISNFIFNSFL